MRNKEWLAYTYRHRRAFEYCARKYVQDPTLRAELLRRARIHDMDKMVMYLFMDQQKAQQLHIQTQPHHLENHLPRTHADLVETVIDYECVPLYQTRQAAERLRFRAEADGHGHT